MKCPIETGEGAESLLAYGAGKLDAESAAYVSRHIEICASCRELAAGQRAVWEALDAWEAAPVAAANFDRRLYQRIEKEVSWWDRMLRPFRPLVWRQGLPVAAAAALVLVAVALSERPAGIPMTRGPIAAQVDIVAPDQAEHALEEMEMMRELNRLVHPEAVEPPKM